MKLFFAKKEKSLGIPELPYETLFNDLRKTEYARLDATNQIYLDYTGGNLYGSSQLKKHQEMLMNNVFGNPHSTNPSSQFATKLVEESRQSVIDFFNAEDYFCIFTPNASGALKIVGECYPFDKNSEYLLFADNHNSVNGIREYCQQKGGNFTYAPMQAEDLNIDGSKLETLLDGSVESDNKLFAYPAQSNVSGVKHSLDWIEKAHAKGWDVLLDAAAFAPTSKLDLKAVSPDFVTISFYKIFGYPTGLGCLFVRKDKFEKLNKQWFAGGTVRLASVRSPHHYLANDHERYENGTINYLDIPALKIGIDFIENIGMDKISKRVKGLIDYTYKELKSLKHSNGMPQLEIFGPANRKNTGGTLILSFFNDKQEKVNFGQIEEMANQRNISIRSGCFCNPGIDETNNSISGEELLDYFTSRDDGDYNDMINHLNKMRGATRLSVGIATTHKDLVAFIDFVKSLKDK